MVRIVHIVMKLLENGTMLTAGIFWPNARDPRAEEWGGRRERRQEGQKGRTEEDQVLHPLKDWIAREFLRREVWLGRHLIAKRALEWECENESDVEAGFVWMWCMDNQSLSMVRENIYATTANCSQRPTALANSVASVLLDPGACFNLYLQPGREGVASQTQLYFCKYNIFPAHPPKKGVSVDLVAGDVI